MKLSIDSTLGRRIAALSLPVVAAMLSQTAINLVDHILVGHLPDDERTAGQAALGISLILFWMVGGFLSAIAVGTQSLTARRVGEDAPEKAGQVLTNSVLAGFSASFLASLLGFLAVPLIFPFVHKDAHLLELGEPYLRWRMLGVCSMVTTTAYKSF